MQEQGGEYEESRGKLDCKDMAWTILKQVLCLECFSGCDNRATAATVFFLLN